MPGPRSRPSSATALLLALAAAPSAPFAPLAPLAAQAPAAPTVAKPMPATAPALDAVLVQAIAQRAFAKFEPTGLALAVVQDGEPLAEVALGEARAGAPLSPRTVFNIASCSKAFTAALIAQLVQEKKLGWDDRVVDHLPAFRMADPWITAHMTVRDLLSHRCGLATFAGDLLWYGADYTDAEVFARIERLPITQQFRSQFGYQNLMYLVAGMLAERVTGQSWEDLIEQRFLRPLGMQDSTTSAQRLSPGADHAMPHIDGREVEEHVFVASKPAASIESSVHDLTPWIRMWLHGGKHGDVQLLDAASLRELWRPHVSIGGGSAGATTDFRSYGLGWFLYVEDGQKLVEHDGGMPGYLSKVSLLPAAKFGFAVLNNANDGVLNEAIKRALLTARQGGDPLAVVDRLAIARERMRERDRSATQKREAARIANTKPTLDLAAYAGRYEDAVYGPAEIQSTGEGLRIVLLPSQRRLQGELRHWHHDVFRVDFPDRFLPFALVNFTLDHEGRVHGFRIDCPIADFDFAALDFRRAPTPR